RRTPTAGGFLSRGLHRFGETLKISARVGHGAQPLAEDVGVSGLLNRVADQGSERQRLELPSRIRGSTGRGREPLAGFPAPALTLLHDSLRFLRGGGEVGHLRAQRLDGRARGRRCRLLSL